MALRISSGVRAKLSDKHGVSEAEIRECFATRDPSHKFLKDLREEHATDPPTLWFIAETYHARKLKVVFVKDGRDIFIKTAYQPNSQEIEIYEKHGK